MRSLLSALFLLAAVTTAQANLYVVTNNINTTTNPAVSYNYDQGRAARMTIYATYAAQSLPLNLNTNHSVRWEWRHDTDNVLVGQWPGYIADGAGGKVVVTAALDRVDIGTYRTEAWVIQNNTMKVHRVAWDYAVVTNAPPSPVDALDVTIIDTNIIYGATNYVAGSSNHYDEVNRTFHYDTNQVAGGASPDTFIYTEVEADADHITWQSNSADNTTAYFTFTTTNGVSGGGGGGNVYLEQHNVFTNDNSLIGKTYMYGAGFIGSSNVLMPGTSRFRGAVGVGSGGTLQLSSIGDAYFAGGVPSGSISPNTSASRGIALLGGEGIELEAYDMKFVVALGGYDLDTLNGQGGIREGIFGAGADITIERSTNFVALGDEITITNNGGVFVWNGNHGAQFSPQRHNYAVFNTDVQTRSNLYIGRYWSHFRDDGTNIFYVNATGGTEQVTGL